MLKIHWFLPTGGDSRDIVPSADGAPPRPPSLDYLTQVAQAAEILGFDALLTPCGTGCEDAWVSTAMLISRTSRVKFLVAFRPGLLLDLPAPVRWTSAAQHRRRRRAHRARTFR